MRPEREKLSALLDEAGLADWMGMLETLLASRLSPKSHGDLPAWQAIIDSLPALGSSNPRLDTPVVQVDLPDSDALEHALMALSPWRKGPFRLGSVHIDSEWRSDLKWDRLRRGISPLAGRRVLDVGCGNGYYAYRMIGSGASCVLGVDPTLLFVAQFTALSRYLPSERLVLLPLRLEELPEGERSFDTVFSMGVLYHQRSPLQHLSQLLRHIRPGGELVLETIVLPGEEAFARTPTGRYARMRNVWMLPSVPELETWLRRSGFRDLQVVDVTMTTIQEQRPTDWMRFESLAQALEPEDSGRTIEGWPAPHRAIIRASAPR